MNHVAFELTSWNLHNLGDTEIVGTHFCAGKMNARIFGLPPLVLLMYSACV